MQENNPPSGTREAVARAVRNAIAERKTSGRLVADQIKMPQSVFSRRMTGEVAFRTDELIAIAAALGVPVSSLIQGADEPEAVAS